MSSSSTRPNVRLRPLSLDDATELADLYTRNRTFLAPFEPARAADFFTVDGQRKRLQQLEQERSSGGAETWAIDLYGALAGMISLSNIVRGPFQSANVGYWVSEEHNGQGVATTALSQVVRMAHGSFALHRLEAATLTDNAGSQRVLERNGFAVIGTAPGYLSIAGRWQDHVLFQRLQDALH